MDEENINLMPEDQRSKERELLAKQKRNWEHDLVIPDQVDKMDKSKPSGSKVSVWTKLFKSKKFPKPNKDEIKQDKKPSKPSKAFTPVDKVEPKFDWPKIEDSKFKTHKKTSKDKDKKHKKDKHKDAKIPIVPDLEQKPMQESKPAVPPVVPDKKDELNLADWHQPKQAIRAKFVDEGVDLIPTSVKIKSWPQIRNLLLVSFVLSIIIVALFYIGLMWQERKNINERQLSMQGISELEEEILNFQSTNQEIKDLAEDIKTIHTILNQHIYWSNFFELLEKYTVQEVHYQGLTAGNNGALVLDAIGPNFDAVARQLKALQSPEATELAREVSVTSATLTEVGVSFNVNFILNSQLFYYENN